MITCPATQQTCARDCPLPTECAILMLANEASPVRQVDRGCAYFIPMSYLGAIEIAAKKMITDSQKRRRRVELNHIQQVLKTLNLIPHSEKVVGLSIGALDNGDAGLFILCSRPHRVVPDIPSNGSNYAKERKDAHE